MAVRIGINGFGRIGRYAARLLAGSSELELVAVNARADNESMAHLFKYDSVHGTFSGSVEANDQGFLLEGKQVLITRQPAGEWKWGDLGVDVVLEKGDKRYVFIDTAGLRRRNKVRRSLEQVSVLHALKTSSRADVTILLLDALEGVTVQDKKILDYLSKEKVPVIVAVNKIDLVPRAKLAQVKDFLQQEISFCPHLPLIYTSSVNKSGLGGILPLAEKVWDQYNKRISTGELNRYLQAVLEKHRPPVAGNRRPKFYYMTQPEVAPPTFVFFLNDHRLIGQQYIRYLEKQLRKFFGLHITPVRLLFRTSQG